MRSKVERLRLLDELSPPDLWPNIRQREPSTMPESRAPAGRRLAAAFVALGVATAGTSVVIGAFSSGERNPPVAQPDAERIVFSGGGGDATLDLLSMNADGSDVRTITATSASETHPTASPDGSRLAFAVREPDDPASSVIGVMNADGSNRGAIEATRLAGNAVDDPAWSPRGSEIAFAAFGEGGGIYVADLDGNRARRLTSAGPPTIHVDRDPAWSPIGESIAFIRWSLGDEQTSPAYEIFEVATAGGTPSLIASFPAPTRGTPDDNGEVRGLSWSPDGSRLAFATQGAIFTVDVETGRIQEFVPCEDLGCGDGTDVFTDATAWSHDGERIAFTAWRNVPREVAEAPDIYVATLEGGTVTVTSTGVRGLDPVWQPVPKEDGVEPSATGSITFDGDVLPEGRLLVQVADQVELITQESAGSSLVGTEMVALDLSPDGSRALVSMPFETKGADTTLLSIDLDTGEETLIADVEGWTFPAEWSPDGSRVAYRVGEQNTLCIRDLAVPEPRCLPEIGAVYAFDWSPDGTRIVMDQPPPGLLTVLEVGSFETRIVARWNDASVLDALRDAGLGEPVVVQFQRPLLSPSGEHVAVLAMVRTDEGPAGNVVLVLDQSGDVVARGAPFREFSDARDWAPTGDTFAYAAGEPPYRIDEARLLDPSTGTEQLFISTADEPPQMIQSLVWSPTGRWLALSVYPSEIRLIDATGIEPPSVFRSPLDDAVQLVGWEPLGPS